MLCRKTQNLHWLKVLNRHRTSWTTMIYKRIQMRNVVRTVNKTIILHVIVCGDIRKWKRTLLENERPWETEEIVFLVVNNHCSRSVASCIFTGNTEIFSVSLRPYAEVYITSVDLGFYVFLTYVGAIRTRKRSNTDFYCDGRDVNAHDEKKRKTSTSLRLRARYLRSALPGSHDQRENSIIKSFTRRWSPTIAQSTDQPSTDNIRHVKKTIR